MYITGGVGSTHHGEAFSFDYDLPNDTVYAETCASIGLVFFAHRLQQMEAKSTYADVIERILYNLIPGSISLEGREFFYVNPLEVWPEACEKNPGKHHIKAERQKWFGCACCPPNVARLIASLGDYIYSISNNTLFTHFYISGDVEVSLPSGKFNLRQESDYPHNGNINFKIFTHEPVKFSLALRIPNWCKEFKLFINGEVLDLNDKINDGYAYLNRTWIYGDCITVEMEMPVEILQSNPKVRANAGKVCIQRGPVVYCVEEADNGENLSALTLCIDKGFKTENININSNKAMVVIAKGLRTKEDGWDDILYRPVGSNMEEPVIIKAVPYYLWGNRGIGEMQVWIRYKHTT